MNSMPNLYFPICAFFVSLLLFIVFFSKKRVKNSETKIYSFMLIASLLNTIFSVALMFCAYFGSAQDLLLPQILNRLDFLQYLMWTNLLLLYVVEISLSDKDFYKKNRASLFKINIAINVIVYLFIIGLPLELHNDNDVMYAYGSSVELLYTFCGIYLLLMFFIVFMDIRRIINKKYFPILVLLLLGVIIMVVRQINPGLLIIPATIAYINLIMFFTIENPDLKLVKQKEEINRRLKGLNQSKDEFLSLASHQLRTPLTSICGYSSMLLDGDMGEMSNEQQHAVKEIESSSERMVATVRDLLNVSRIEAGSFVLERIKTNLPAILKENLDQLQLMAESHEVKLIYKAPANGEIPELNIDRERIGEIMANLIDNAIFYSRAGKSVHVSLAHVGDFVEFKVVDHGIGVPTKEQAHLFTKFFRASNAKTMRPDGTGIGLFLVRKIIEEHGGEIIFRSIQGKGSTFGFRLPIAK